MLLFPGACGGSQFCAAGTKSGAGPPDGARPISLSVIRVVGFRGPHRRSGFGATASLGLLPRDCGTFAMLYGFGSGAGPRTAVAALLGMARAFRLERSFDRGVFLLRGFA